jgi:hypothetical protein
MFPASSCLFGESWLRMNIEDRIAITDLINLHGHYADDGDLDGVDALFTEEAVTDLSSVGGAERVDRAGIRARALNAGDKNPVANLVTNIVLSPIGPDEVHARSKGLVIRADGGAGSVTYEDVVVRTEQGWRISKRSVIARRVPLSGVHRQD